MRHEAEARMVARGKSKFALAVLLGASLLALSSGQAQAKSANCTPGPGLDLRGCDFSNANISRTDFTGSNLAHANLSNANLTGSNFTNANLSGANLSGAGLVMDCTSGPCPILLVGFQQGGYFLIEYDLHLNLTNANLKNADLTGARLDGGAITGGQYCFKGMCWPGVLGFPGAILNGVRSGGITGTPASLPARWELANGFLVRIIPPLQITDSSLPDGALKMPYSVALTATGGISPYKWSVIGSLPPGLHLQSGSGTIFGKPRAVGTYSFTVQVTDSKTMERPRTQRTSTQLLSINVP